MRKSANTRTKMRDLDSPMTKTRKCRDENTIYNDEYANHDDENSIHVIIDLKVFRVFCVFVFVVSSSYFRVFAC